MMIKQKFQLLFLLALPFLVPSQSAFATPAYFVSPGDLKLEIKNEKWKEEKYQLKITRSFENDEQSKLLKKAESLYADRKIVLKILSKNGKTTVPKTAPLWWCDSFDGVRIPYSITAASVVYYRKMIESFRTRNGKGAAVVMKGAQMKYFADIKHHDTFTVNKRSFENVDVAYMQLDWSQFCGSLCAMSFRQKRTVVFESNGQATVIGDGEPGVLVS